YSCVRALQYPMEGPCVQRTGVLRVDQKDGGCPIVTWRRGANRPPACSAIRRLEHSLVVGRGEGPTEIVAPKTTHCVHSVRGLRVNRKRRNRERRNIARIAWQPGVHGNPTRSPV